MSGAAATQLRMSEPEVRKVVTVLFSDVTDSTRLGQELDPEAVRQLVSRYFGEMKVVVERHGGVVEKFIGDAVMAVFGVPQAHEDDALRAVRAAQETRDELRRLNEEFHTSWGVTLVARTARRASSSWTTGTPKTAITASPMNFSTVPPWRSITARIASK